MCARVNVVVVVIFWLLARFRFVLFFYLEALTQGWISEKFCEKAPKPTIQLLCLIESETLSSSVFFHLMKKKCRLGNKVYIDFKLETSWFGRSAASKCTADCKCASTKQNKIGLFDIVCTHEPSHACFMHWVVHFIRLLMLLTSRLLLHWPL